MFSLTSFLSRRLVLGWDREAGSQYIATQHHPPPLAQDFNIPLAFMNLECGALIGLSRWVTEVPFLSHLKSAVKLFLCPVSHMCKCEETINEGPAA